MKKKYKLKKSSVLWYVQKRKKLLFINYWSTVFISPFLDEAEEAIKKLRSL